MAKIEWIVFDLGGVVVDINLAGFLQTLAQQTGLGQSVVRHMLLEDFDDQPFSLIERYELGFLTDEQFLEEAVKTLKRRVTPEQFQTAWLSILVQESPEMLALLKALAPKYRLACYSNTNSLHWQHMQRDYQCFNYFEVALASFLTQRAKPDVDAFRHLETAINVKSEHCLFIDDNQSNVEAAMEEGFSAVLYAHLPGLCHVLPEYGIDVSLGS